MLISFMQPKTTYLPVGSFRQHKCNPSAPSSKHTCPCTRTAVAAYTHATHSGRGCLSGQGGAAHVVRAPRGPGCASGPQQAGGAVRHRFQGARTAQEDASGERPCPHPSISTAATFSRIACGDISFSIALMFVVAEASSGMGAPSDCCNF